MTEKIQNDALTEALAKYANFLGIDVSLMEPFDGFFAKKDELELLENSEYSSEAREELRALIKKRKAFKFKKNNCECVVVFERISGEYKTPFAYY